MSSSLKGFLALVFALLALALAAAPASMAETAAAPPAAESPAAESEGATQEPPAMSVEFTRRRAGLVGSRALVFVRCSGSIAETCEGTLVLSGLGGAHKVPYSIAREQHEVLAVPLGPAGESAPHGAKLRAVSHTLQLSGGTVSESSLLRIR